LIAAGCNGSDSNFAVKNMESITRIELSDTNNCIILSATEKGEWMVSSFRANMANIRNLQKILSDIETEYPLPKIYDSVYDNKKITDEGILIKAFRGKNLVKSYSLLVTGEPDAEAVGLATGKRQAYVLTLPGQDIDFSDYISTESAFWENNILFSCNPGEIKYVKVENMENPDNSFSIKTDDSISLFDADGGNIRANRSKTERYLSYFNNISFVGNLNMTDDEKQKTVSAELLYILNIESDTDSITCYVYPISDNNLDDYGNPLVYDRDFFNLVVPQKKLFAKAAWLRFDILLEDLNYFLE
jgi:hypothetical protein